VEGIAVISKLMSSKNIKLSELYAANARAVGGVSLRNPVVPLTYWQQQDPSKILYMHVIVLYVCKYAMPGELCEPFFEIKLPMIRIFRPTY
jgi:hypothetical protein